MQSKHVPLLSTKYWIALIIASIFGANTGDYFSDSLGLGHVSGLPFLLVLFAITLVCERFDKTQHYIYYWLAIVIVRTSATNVGDIFHDVNISFLISIPCLFVALCALLFLWRYHTRSPEGNASPNVIQANGFYWVAMLLAGTLGTVMGDYFSYPLKLGNLNAALILGAVLALTFFIGRNGLLKHIFYFWFAVVVIRSAGTAAGDYFANHVLGLPLSTVVTGAIFIGFLVFWKNRTTQL